MRAPLAAPDRSRILAFMKPPVISGRRFIQTLAFFGLALAFPASTHASPPSHVTKIAAQLGVRFNDPARAEFKAGSKILATVIDSQKLGGHDLHVQAGDKVVIAVHDGTRFTVTHEASRKTRSFLLNEKGTIRPAS